MALQGSGTAFDPYLVSSFADLQYIYSNPQSSTSTTYYKQTANITCTSPFVMSARAFIFPGTNYYYGEGFTIKDLDVSNTGISTLSVFSTAYIYDLYFDNIYIHSESNSTSVHGVASVAREMKNVKVTGTVLSNNSASGLASTGYSIEDSSFEGILYFKTNSAGLINTGNIAGRMNRCSFKGTATGVGTSSNFAGICYATSNTYPITDCFFDGEINTEGASSGIANQNGIVNNCYVKGVMRCVRGSGLVGRLDDLANVSVSNSFCLLDYIQRKSGVSDAFSDIAITPNPSKIVNCYTINTFKVIDSLGVVIP